MLLDRTPVRIVPRTSVRCQPGSFVGRLPQPKPDAFPACRRCAPRTLLTERPPHIGIAELSQCAPHAPERWAPGWGTASMRAFGA